MSQAAVDRANARAKPDDFHRCIQCGSRFLTASGLQHHVAQAHKRKPSPKREVISDPSGKLAYVTVVASGISGRMLSKVQLQGDACLWCGKPFELRFGNEHPLAPSREHDVPKSLGGKKILGLVHRRCNLVRGIIDAAAFRRLMNGEALRKEELWPHVFEEPTS